LRNASALASQLFGIRQSGVTLDATPACQKSLFDEPN
jgi:hypothetical protein